MGNEIIVAECTLYGGEFMDSHGALGKCGCRCPQRMGSWSASYMDEAWVGIVGSGIQIFSKSKNCYQALHNSAETQILLGPFCRKM